MAEVKVLIEGYARKIGDGWVASSTTTLVIINDKKIIIDPGCNREKLIEELSHNNLTISDIDYVLLSHTHMDHILLCGIFENAKVVTSREIYNGDNQVDYGDNIEGLDIEIIKTPGHSMDSRSFAVKTDNGAIVIAADLFWWMDEDKQKTDYESLLNHADPYVKDEKVLKESRKKILKIADYIIPGHGKMFKVEK